MGGYGCIPLADYTKIVSQHEQTLIVYSDISLDAIELFSKFSVSEKVNSKSKMTPRVKPEENEIISSTSKSNFAKFCKDTSLHGWSYLNHSKMPKVWKFFWSTFLMIIVLLSVFFFVINTNQVKLN